MKVKVEKFPIRHNGKKYLLGETFDIDKKETEELLKKGYISIVEADEETIEEETMKAGDKTETTEEEVINPEEKVKIKEEEVIVPKEKTEIAGEEIENSELSKKNKNKTTKKK